MASVASFRRELDVFLEETLSVEGRRRIFVGIARDELSKFEADWRAALTAPNFERFVDGKKDAPLESVRIDGGTIAERVRAIGPVLDRALELFDVFTKVLTGDYKSQTAVFVDGARVSRGAEPPPSASYVSIVNLSPFARKAEVRGFNDKDDSGFRNGLFESLAAIITSEFKGSGAGAAFSFDEYGGVRLPELIIG